MDPGAAADPRPGSARPAARAEVLATLAIVLGFLGVVGSRPILRRLGAHPSREECAAMLDRYAEQQARAVDPERGAHGPGLDEAPRGRAEPKEIDRCTRELDPEELACAMRSSNADELERCLPP